ncbi:MAG: c-type cytochrome [Bacteroidetes bacterium]|nr:c-type cytochrome [Bacteroidota bacterium]
MEFLKELALPQSYEHVQLLLFILNLVYVVFLPYLGLLLSASVIARVYERKGNREGKANYGRFAEDLVALPLSRKSLPLFLGIIPALSLVFVYAQLFQKTAAITVGLMGYGFLVLLLAAILLYSYRFTFTVGGVLRSYQRVLRARNEGTDDAAEVEAYERSNLHTHERSGRYGVVLLVIAVLLCVGAMTVAMNPDSWENLDTVFALFVSVSFYAKLLQFLTAGLAVTGLAVLFFFFIWEGGTGKADDQYARFAQQQGLTLAVVAVLLQPLLLVLNVILLPVEALSGALFGLAGAAVLLFFLTAHFLYAYSKVGRRSYISYAFYTLGLSLVLLFTNDQVAIGNATREHTARLAYDYALAREDLQSRLGIAMAVMSGDEIYSAKCSSCHLFNQKKVGPPYQSVMQKYRGKKAQLVSFVLHPVKVDPEYPPMPNQGLKPAEADSIATYLLAKFGDGETGEQAVSPEEGGEEQ